MRDIHEFINRSLPPIERGCLSKSRFSTRGEANSAARHNRHSDGSVRSYHCRYCAEWHLGHRRRRKTR